MVTKAMLGRALVCVATAALMLACGGGGGGGPTGPPASNVVGRYSITHTLVVDGIPAISCPGVLDITSQNGTTFAGTISISSTPGCEAFASEGTVNGTVTSQGVLSFTVTIPLIERLLEEVECEIASGGTTFAGTATTSGLSATRNNQVQCEDGTEGDFAYTIAGQKT